MQSQTRLNKLFLLCKISSENLKDAISDHLVKGLDEKNAALLNDVKKENLSRALKRLNEIAAIVEDIKEYDYQKR